MMSACAEDLLKLFSSFPLRVNNTQSLIHEQITLLKRSLLLINSYQCQRTKVVDSSYKGLI